MNYFSPASNVFVHAYFSISMVGRHALKLVLLCMSFPLFGQEDMYHQWLRDYLDDEYGISTGEWVLGETEEEAFNTFGIQGHFQIRFRTCVIIAARPAE